MENVPDWFLVTVIGASAIVAVIALVAFVIIVRRPKVGDYVRIVIQNAPDDGRHYALPTLGGRVASATLHGVAVKADGATWLFAVDDLVRWGKGWIVYYRDDGNA